LRDICGIPERNRTFLQSGSHSCGRNIYRLAKIDKERYPDIITADVISILYKLNPASCGLYG